ncbi:hypothetical protein B0H13DRAFT_2664195 [Mycena leptocephala]|nr:hypothetical protein B0H13DRAFT_2664195 [Mycena leptocephala]
MPRQFPAVAAFSPGPINDNRALVPVVYLAPPPPVAQGFLSFSRTGPRRLSPLTTAFSYGARAHDDTPPTAPLPAPATSTNPIPNLNTSGRHRSDAYTPSALPRLLGLRASFSSSSSSQGKGRQQDEGGEEQHAQGEERNLRAESAALFVAWWRAGGADPYADLGGHGQSYEDEHLRAQPGYARVDSAERGRRRRMDEAARGAPCPAFSFFGFSAFSRQQREVPLPLPVLPLRCTRPRPRTHRPLHLPSLLAPLGCVVRAAFSSPLRFYSSSNNGRGVRGGWAWGRVDDGETGSDSRLLSLRRLLAMPAADVCGAGLGSTFFSLSVSHFGSSVLASDFWRATSAGQVSPPSPPSRPDFACVRGSTTTPTCTLATRAVHPSCYRPVSTCAITIFTYAITVFSYAFSYALASPPVFTYGYGYSYAFPQHVTERASSPCGAK